MRKKNKLYRCKFIKETELYIVGKDVFNNKTYHIKKNKETNGFKIGTDTSFYATLRVEGILFKKRILNVINYDKLVEENSKKIE